MIKYCTNPKTCKHFNELGHLIMPAFLKGHEVKDYMAEMMEMHERDTLIVTLPADRRRWADVVGNVDTNI